MAVWIRTINGSSTSAHGGFKSVGDARKVLGDDIRHRKENFEQWTKVNAGKWERADGVVMEVVTK